MASEKPRSIGTDSRWPDTEGLLTYDGEHVLFNEGNIWVTARRFVNGVATYAIADIGGVHAHRAPPPVRLLSAGVALGAVALVWLDIYIGLGVWAATAMFWAARPPVIELRLKVNNGERVPVLTSRNRQLVDRVYVALVRSLREHAAASGQSPDA